MIVNFAGCDFFLKFGWRCLKIASVCAIQKTAILEALAAGNKVTRKLDT